MSARVMSYGLTLFFVVLTSCYTLAMYLEMSFLFYEGVYFWASAKLLCCLFFACAIKEKYTYPSILEEIGLGPLKMYRVGRKRRTTATYVNPAPKSQSVSRSGSVSTFHGDVSQPLLRSAAIYNPYHLMALDSAVNSSEESAISELRSIEVFDKDGDIAKSIYLYVLLYIGPHMVLNIARYSSLVAKHEVFWVGSGLKSEGLSASFFWVTSFIAILSWPFYYSIVVMLQKRTGTSENWRLDMMEVEMKKNVDTRVSDLAKLRSAEPAQKLISVVEGEIMGLEDYKEPLKDCHLCDHGTERAISRDPPSNFIGFYSAGVMKRSFGDLSRVTSIN